MTSEIPFITFFPLIIENIFSQPPDPFLTYDKILQELSHPSRVPEKQIVLQLQVLSAALSAVRSHDLSAWDSIVDLLEKYQLDTANMKFDPLKSHKIRFITYYTMVLERAGFLESTNARKIDKIIDIYLKHLIGKEEYQNILELYSYMHDEKAKVDGIAYFLANIQNEVQQVKLKQELDSLLPKGLVDEILSEINHFIDMSNISDPKEYAKKKIASLRWLSLNSSAMDVAVDAASQAIRQFILRDDLESALEVTMTILNKCFEQLKEKDPKGYTNTLLFMSFYSEKESIAGLLECYITHKKIQKVAETYLKGDSEDIVKIQNDFNTQGPLSGLLKVSFIPWHSWHDLISGICREGA